MPRAQIKDEKTCRHRSVRASIASWPGGRRYLFRRPRCRLRRSRSARPVGEGDSHVLFISPLVLQRLQCHRGPV